MNRLRHYRKVNSMSQKYLADKVHMSQGRVCQIERGYTLPNAAEAFALANYFGIKVESMFPDGVKAKLAYDTSRRQEAAPLPPEPPAPRVVGYLSTCPKCGAQQIFDNCYACGKGLEVEEAVA